MPDARRRTRALLVYAEHNQTLSYQLGWPRHFQRHPRFECLPMNLADGRVRELIAGQLQLWFGRFDVVILLHSVFSNGRLLAGRLFNAIRALPQPKAYFIGNEYKLMPEKMAFCEELGVALLVTMNPNARAQALYRDRLGCAVTCIPSAGLDAELFRPGAPRDSRPIDLGFRGWAAPPYLGHQERRQIGDYFVRRAGDYGLRVDVSFDTASRLTEKEWAGFLQRCKGQLGTEAGGDYFELTDETRMKVNRCLIEEPETSADQIFEKYFRGYPDPVPVRTISGRHVEAAGTKTIQILFEGAYSGYFRPDEHYIPLKKDFNNADTAIAKFLDVDFCRRVADNAYAVVHQELTYERLIDRFADAFAAIA